MLIASRASVDATSKQGASRRDDAKALQLPQHGAGATRLNTNVVDGCQEEKKKKKTNGEKLGFDISPGKLLFMT